MSYTFVHPSTILVSGPTGSGKTEFVKKVILRQMFDKKPTRVIWVYNEDQPAYRELRQLMPNVQFVRGLPDDLYESIKPQDRNLLILDDVMNTAGDSKVLSRLFTEGSHHRNLTVMYLVQNLFDKGKSHRNVSLNSKVMVLFKNPRDKQQVAYLGKQVFPKHKNFLLDAFEDATREPYEYLLVDLHPNTPDNLRVHAKIFNYPGTVYVPHSNSIKGQVSSTFK
jgi:hypothetical protein